MTGGRKGYTNRCSAAVCRVHPLEELNDIDKIEPDEVPGEMARHLRRCGGIRADCDGDGELDRSERRELDVVDRRRELVVIGSEHVLRGEHLVVGREHVVDAGR